MAPTPAAGSTPSDEIVRAHTGATGRADHATGRAGATAQLVGPSHRLDAPTDPQPMA